MSEDRLVSSIEQQEDLTCSPALRPANLDDFIGQDGFKRQLRVFVEAARNRGEALDHVLLAGPPGLGKTTLAHILSSELGAEIIVTAGPVLERQGDLASILTRLSAGDILFIDEIHRMNRSVEEILYSAMEDYKLDIMLGKGPSAQSVRIDVQPFTLVGATTRSGLLSSPLRDRFGIMHNLEFYTDDELFKIISRSSSVLDVAATDRGIKELSRRSRGTPRIANRLLRRVRDFAQVEGDGSITFELAKSALDLLGIDSMGLTAADRRLMELLLLRYSDFPVGVRTLSVSLGEEADTIAEVYEPYLIKIGFIARTPRGRVATPEAYKYFGIPYDGTGLAASVRGRVGNGFDASEDDSNKNSDQSLLPFVENED